jgi:hypothetical protein
MSFPKSRWSSTVVIILLFAFFESEQLYISHYICKHFAVTNKSIHFITLTPASVNDMYSQETLNLSSFLFQQRNCQQNVLYWAFCK